MFKHGDSVVRTGPNYGTIKFGDKYTVKSVYEYGSIELEGITGRYAGKLFKLAGPEPEYVDGYFSNPNMMQFKDLDNKDKLNLIQAALEGHIIECKCTRTQHQWSKLKKVTEQGSLDMFHADFIMRVDVESIRKTKNLEKRRTRLEEELKEVNNQLGKLRNV